MKKILFPTDFSKTANKALEYATAFAGQFEATIDLMSIYSIPLADAGSVPPQHIEKMLEEKKQMVLAKLEGLRTAMDHSIQGEIRADYGIFIYQEVVDAARQGAYDLIMMGTKGEHNRIENLLGSVTSHTMMHAHCPVLAIPEGSSFEPIQRIAYATDFHPTDEHAVEQLFEWSGTLGATVHFVHVEKTKKEISASDEGETGETPMPFSNFTVVRHSDISAGLDTYIKTAAIDLLALFIPRRRLWERLFHTSFTKKMAFHSRTPILVFHE